MLWETEAACPLEEVEVTTSSKCYVKDRNSDYVYDLTPLTKKGGEDFYTVGKYKVRGVLFLLNVQKPITY